MRNNIVLRIIRFYVEGFRRMPGWGRYLWIIILVKAFFMFAILKVFFMPDLLEKNFKNDRDRAGYVLENLTNKN